MGCEGVQNTKEMYARTTTTQETHDGVMLKKWNEWY